MKRLKIPDTELEIFPLGLGCVNVGLKWNDKEVREIFDSFLDRGGNLFDTARVYSDWIPPERGRSERIIGDWLAGSNKKREKIIITTKGGHPKLTGKVIDMHKSRMSKKEMTIDLELSLQALRTDIIDIYFYHRDDESLTAEELIETMEGFVKQGKIRYYGCSNWSTRRIMEADAYSRTQGYRGFVANQVLYNIGSKHMLPMEDDTLVSMTKEMAEYHKRTPSNLAMAYTSICGGFFSKLIEQGPEFVKGSPYYTEENLKIAKEIKMTSDYYGITAMQAVLIFFVKADFPCLPLFGPRDVSNLYEAMEMFE
jgi:aryl-alcohol dehydrogenase-like predicted oxidoreductase